MTRKSPVTIHNEVKTCYVFNNFTFEFSHDILLTMSIDITNLRERKAIYADLAEKGKDTLMPFIADSLWSYKDLLTSPNPYYLPVRKDFLGRLVSTSLHVLRQATQIQLRFPESQVIADHLRDLAIRDGASEKTEVAMAIERIAERNEEQLKNERSGMSTLLIASSYILNSLVDELSPSPRNSPQERK